MKQSKKQQASKQAEGQLIQHEERATTRLNKYISDSGLCSRRAADRLIEENRVTIDGIPAGIGVQVAPGQQVFVDGNLIEPTKKLVYLALNKPAGITCTTDVLVEGNLTTFMNYPELIFPVGRLDKESTGLLLLTNDGDIVNKILREENGHEKEYFVQVDKPITGDFISKMEAGVEIYNPVANKYQTTNPCKVVQSNKDTFRLTLGQGLNRQIRRMTHALGYRTLAISRLRVMNIQLGSLPLGQWRYLTKEELEQINTAIQP